MLDAPHDDQNANSRSFGGRLSAAFRARLAAIGGAPERGAAPRAARATGLSAHDIRRWLRPSGPSRRERIALDHVETWAQHTGQRPWQVVREIEARGIPAGPEADLSHTWRDFREFLESQLLTDAELKRALRLLEALADHRHLRLLLRIGEALLEHGATAQGMAEIVAVINADPQPPLSEPDREQRRKALAGVLRA